MVETRTFALAIMRVDKEGRINPNFGCPITGKSEEEVWWKAHKWVLDAIHYSWRRYRLGMGQVCTRKDFTILPLAKVPKVRDEMQYIDKDGKLTPMRNLPEEVFKC